MPVDFGASGIIRHIILLDISYNRMQSWTIEKSKKCANVATLMIWKY